MMNMMKESIILAHMLYIITSQFNQFKYVGYKLVLICVI